MAHLLDDWRGKRFETVVADLRDLVEDADYPTVRRWREAGGKVVGHFQVYFPEEIVHAAGLLPREDPRRADRGAAGRRALRRPISARS